MERPVLDSITISNFRLFRSKVTFPLNNATYFIGPNNAGKSTVLHAIRYFFDDTLYESRDFLNKTFAARRTTGYNVCKIAITFKTSSVTKVTLRKKLSSKYGETVVIEKSTKLTDLGVLSSGYSVGGRADVRFEHLDEALRELLGGIKINYIHPQRGEALLREAQAKLKRRLLDNFGRGKSQVTKHLQNFDGDWEKLRSSASEYLSAGLQAYIEHIWPGGKVTVALPRDIKDLLEVSEISFSGFEGEPPVELLNHGSGAQVLILYLTHFLLDIDKTQSRNSFSQPVWLLEEPESFLHADLCLKLGDQLNSEEWLGNIQLIAATHSPILLSRSGLQASAVVWSVLENAAKPVIIRPADVTTSQITQIGHLLGDANFEYYFSASGNDLDVVTEDTRVSTINVFRRSGISVSKGIEGISNFKRMIQSLRGLGEEVLHSPKVAIVDRDHGFKEIENLLSPKSVDEQADFELFVVNSLRNAYVISLPIGLAAEDLMNELDSQLDIVVNEIFDASMTLRDHIPTRYSELVSKTLRGKELSREEAKKKIKASYDFKNYFWHEMDSSGHVISNAYADAIKRLIEAARQL